MKIALVTGANRGLGLGTARALAKQGIQVIITSRDVTKGNEAVEQLRKEGHKILFHPLDITQAAQIQNTFEFVRKEFGRLDILVNNAGVFLSPDTIEAVRSSMETNVYGAFQLCQHFVPLMKERGYGRIVNVSSGMGQLSEMEGGYPGYRISKTALNAVTRIFSAEVSEVSDVERCDVLINSVCPGWVKTDMGGSGAERSIEKGVETIAWLATLPKGGPSGGFFRDKEPINW